MAEPLEREKMGKLLMTPGWEQSREDEAQGGCVRGLPEKTCGSVAGQDAHVTWKEKAVETVMDLEEQALWVQKNLACGARCEARRSRHLLQRGPQWRK